MPFIVCIGEKGRLTKEDLEAAILTRAYTLAFAELIVSWTYRNGAGYTWSYKKVMQGSMFALGSVQAIYRDLLCVGQLVSADTHFF